MPMIICWAMVDSPWLTVELSRSLSYPRGVHNIGLLVKTCHGLRALMKSALPRLITTAASGALSLRRLGGSRSDRSVLSTRLHLAVCGKSSICTCQVKYLLLCLTSIVAVMLPPWAHRGAGAHPPIRRS